MRLWLYCAVACARLDVGCWLVFAAVDHRWRSLGGRDRRACLFPVSTVCNDANVSNFCTSPQMALDWKACCYRGRGRASRSQWPAPDTNPAGMSYFLDPLAQLALYEAPKNGGTTLRLWLAYRLTGRLYLSNPNATYYTGTAEMTAMLREAGYSHAGFTPLESQQKICIKRDPVQRFLSCFQDKIIKEGGYNLTLGEFLDRFEDILAADSKMMEIYGMGKLRFHFQPQVYHFGSDVGYYDHVFSVPEISTKLKDYLEDQWQVKLPELHARDAGIRSLDATLTERDRERICTIYQADFASGWY